MRATTINEDMKIAAARALAELAREDVPDEVAAAYQGARPRYGPNYIIPVPFDPRLISTVPPAVARAAMESGVARRPIVDMEAYRQSLKSRRDPVAGTLQRIFDKVRRNPRRVVFAEGEEELVMRAALSYVNSGLGTAILVGREDRVAETARQAGIDLKGPVEIHNARLSRRNRAYADYLYGRLQRDGYLFRDCQRLINQDRNHFAAAMVALGDADAMVSGVTRHFATVLGDVCRVIGTKPGHRLIGLSIALTRGRTVLIADTAVHELPEPEDLADITEEAAFVARRLGYEPRIALLSHSTFGQPQSERSERVKAAIRILDGRRVDFEYDGEMSPDVALTPDLLAAYPFSRLRDVANVLIMPAIHSAQISTQLLKSLGGATVLGPILFGLDKPAQIVGLGARDADIVNMAALAAYGAVS